MSKRALLGWLLPTLLTLGACKKELNTARNAGTSTTGVATAVDVEVPLPPVESSQLGRSTDTTRTAAPTQPKLRIWNLQFNELQLKGRARVDIGNDQTEATLQVRMRYDSVIWISVTKLGIEGLRAKITRDSVWAINRLNRSYFMEPISALQTRFQVPFTYQMLQAALVGNYLPATGDQAFSQREGRITVIRRQEDSLQIEQFISAARGQLVKLNVRDKRTSNAMMATYEDFRELRAGDREFPFSTRLVVQQPPAAGQAADQGKTVLILLEHKSVAEPEGKQDYPFAIPPDYERK